MSPHPGADGLVQGELPPISPEFDRFHQPCLLPGRTTKDRCGLSSPFLAARFSLLCDGTHGRTLIRPSLPTCATPLPKVFAHTQVRDPHESAAACYRHALGAPSPWPSITSFLFLTFVSCHAGIFSSFSHSFTTSGIFIA